MLNLKNPKTYNEKLQWIKLYNKNPLMPKCCDKYTVREFVEKQECGEILNDLIWEGFKPEDIPFDNLPEKYVIKVTHGSTFNIIQNGTTKISRDEVIEKCLETEPDLVIMDWWLPVIDGIDVLYKIRDAKHIRQPRIIFCSANTDPEKISEALDGGADDYLMKPFDEEIIKSKLVILGLVKE